MQGNFIFAIVRDALKTKLDELSDKKEINDPTIKSFQRKYDPTLKYFHL